MRYPNNLLVDIILTKKCIKLILSIILSIWIHVRKSHIMVLISNGPIVSIVDLDFYLLFLLVIQCSHLLFISFL